MRPVLVFVAFLSATALAQQSTMVKLQTFPQVMPTAPIIGVGSNDLQRILLRPDGVAVVVQLLQEMGVIQSYVKNPARQAELLGFLYELIEWGSDGPPGGFSIATSAAGIPRQVRIGNRKRRSAYQPHEHVDLVFTPKAKRRVALESDEAVAHDVEGGSNDSHLD